MGAIGDAAKRLAKAQAAKVGDWMEARGRKRIQGIQQTAQDKHDQKKAEQAAEKAIAKERKEAEAAFNKAVKDWAKDVRSGDAYKFGNTRVQFHMGRRGVVSMPIGSVMEELTPAEVFKQYYKGPDTEPRKA